MGTERTVSSGAHRLAVRDYGGDGPDLLFIHGAGMNLEAWGPLIDELGDGYRIVTYDLPGHGESRGDEAATWESSLASIGSVIQALSLRSPALVGHSLGGMLGLAHVRAGGAGGGLIDVDGWMGPPMPNRFTPEALSRIETQLTATAMATRDGLDNLIALQRSVGPADGADLATTEAVLRRSYPFDEGDRALRRPSPAETLAMMGSLSELDLRVRAEEIDVPVLYVVAPTGRGT